MYEKQASNGKARIFIGREREISSSLSDVFALCIDGKAIYSFKTNGQDCTSNCRDAAGEIAQQMIKKGIKDYCIENGKRQHLSGIVPCPAISPDGINVFRNTLDARLSYFKVSV